MSDSVRPHRQQPTRLSCPWDSPGKNTRVGCHFPLMKVKSESKVAQSCPTLSDPMDCSPPGSSIHGIFQARVLEWSVIAFSLSGLLFLSKDRCSSEVIFPIFCHLAKRYLHCHVSFLKLLPSLRLILHDSSRFHSLLISWDHYSSILYLSSICNLTIGPNTIASKLNL